MKIAYLDCGAGISGNMFLGALIDMGLPVDFLQTELKKLPIHFPELSVQTVIRKGIQATLFEVLATPEHHHRHLSEILALIKAAQFNPKITETSTRCFSLLAAAEAKIHGTSVEEVHFHEVGAIDAIIDIVGASIGIDYFHIEKMVASPIRVGFGTTSCAHGIITLPAPATVELLTGFNVYGGDCEGEWATPTGSTIIKSFTTGTGPLPPLKISHIGYGAGSTERNIPNVLRLIFGENLPVTENDEFQQVLETNIDDMNPEFFGYIGDLLLEAGAKDYFLTPIQMKKGRPGIKITAIVPADRVAAIEKILLKETTSLGVRKYIVQRTCLTRDFITVSIDGLNIKVKTAWHNGELLNYAPEYEDCLKAAKELGRPLKVIYQEANFEARRILK